jgi:hypothetical protein
MPIFNGKRIRVTTPKLFNAGGEREWGVKSGKRKAESQK